MKRNSIPSRQRLVFLILVLLAFVIVFALDRAAAAQEGGCGLTLWVGGTPVWIEFPCAALTPPAPSPTHTATPSMTPSPSPTPILTPTPSPTPTPPALASATPVLPSATPEWYTPAPGALYPVAQPCRLVSRGGNVNLRAQPWGTILQTLPAGEVVDAVAMTWAASDGTLWLRAVRNGQWVYFARWVMAVRVVTVDDVAIRECADPFVRAVTP